MNVSVFDLHCDTAYALLNSGRQPFFLKRNKLHIDLERAAAFPGYAQCFACFTSPMDSLCRVLTPERVFQMEYDMILQQLQENQGRIRLARSASDIERNRNEDYMSAILTIEGTAGFGYDPGMLDPLYEAGFRMTTLGWNEQNCLAGSHATGGGLTDRGREYVRNAQRLGMLVDVSHISDEAFWDIMDMTQCCVIASHSNSRRVHPASRNLTDEMFMAICATGGVVGMNLYTGFLGTTATVDTVCDHIFHFLELDPTGKHIALGGDLDGCESLPEGFTGVESYPHLADRLLSRDLSPEMLYDLFWNNGIGVIKRCCT